MLFRSVGVGPVEDGVLGELLVGNGLEGRAGEVQCELALYMIERHVGLEGVHALVRLVDDEDVPLEVGHMLELVVFAAEVDGALEVLQAYELDKAFRTAPLETVEVLLAREAVGLLLQGACGADECQSRFGPDKLDVVVVPGVGDCGAVGDDEDLLCAQASAEVVARERLAEARLGVPQVLAVLVEARVVGCLLRGPLLLVAQAVVDGRGRVLDDAVVLAELVEVLVRWVGLYLEPLGAGLVRNVEPAQVAVEVGVVEGLARVLIGRVAAPFEPVDDVCGVGLLRDAPAGLRAGGRLPRRCRHHQSWLVRQRPGS